MAGGNVFAISPEWRAECAEMLIDILVDVSRMEWTAESGLFQTGAQLSPISYVCGVVPGTSNSTHDPFEGARRTAAQLAALRANASMLTNFVRSRLAEEAESSPAVSDAPAAPAAPATTPAADRDLLRRLQAAELRAWQAEADRDIFAQHCAALQGTQAQAEAVARWTEQHSEATTMSRATVAADFDAARYRMEAAFRRRFCAPETQG